CALAAWNSPSAIFCLAIVERLSIWATRLLFSNLQPSLTGTSISIPASVAGTLLSSISVTSARSTTSVFGVDKLPGTTVDVGIVLLEEASLLVELFFPGVVSLLGDVSLPVVSLPGISLLPGLAGLWLIASVAIAMNAANNTSTRIFRVMIQNSAQRFSNSRPVPRPI